MLRLAIPLIGILFLLPAQASARNEPDATVTQVYTLSRSPKETLNLLHRTGAGVWQYGDDRVLGRIERDATYSTAYKYIPDARGTGWHSQAFLAIRDLRGRNLAKAPRRAKDVDQAWFAEYLQGLPKLYRDAGFGVTVLPGEPRFQKHLRAGRKKVRVYFADLGISWKPKEGRAEEYHANVFGFVVNDWLVTLRVHFANDDRTSAFLDGLALTVRKRLPKDIATLKLTSVTPENLETRMHVAVPKGFRRINPGPVRLMPRGSLARFVRHDAKGDWDASIVLERHYSRFDAKRDLAAWKKRHKSLLGEDPSLIGRKVGGRDVHMALADARIDGEAVTVCLVLFKVGTHRYTMRCEHKGVGKKVRSLAIRECTAMLKTLHAWETLPQRS